MSPRRFSQALDGGTDGQRNRVARVVPSGTIRISANFEVPGQSRANSSYFAAASDGEDLDEHHTGDETTNVCCIGNAAYLHAAEDTEAFDELKNEPQSDGNDGWNFSEHSPDDNPNAKIRMQYDVAAKYTGDCTRCSEAGDVRIAAERKGAENMGE